MTKRITIDPITRLEGHGKIEIILNDQGDVDRAYLQVPELRGFEKFCEGRPAEEMPRITPRICGVCPTAHHLASAKCSQCGPDRWPDCQPDGGLDDSWRGYDRRDTSSEAYRMPTAWIDMQT